VVDITDLYHTVVVALLAPLLVQVAADQPFKQHCLQQLHLLLAQVQL
jgi:hypothetical protein